MRYLLAAINAKYIHSNLGIYSLRRYAMERLGLGQKDEQGAAVGMEMVSEAAEGANRTKTVSEIQIDLDEYTINHQMDQILQGYLPEKTGCGGIFLLYLEYRLREGTDPRFEKGSSAGPHLDGRSGGFV